MKIIINLLLSALFCITSLFSASTTLSGELEYFYMTRKSDSKLVNIPFRLFDLNIQHQINDNFNVFGNIGIEYRNRRDSDFMTDSNPQDFLLDLRELYFSIYFNGCLDSGSNCYSEIRIGKQIHSWGNVDENSPIDNLNGYDYYYLLLGGSKKKLGVYSLAYDYIFGEDNKFKLSMVYSPMHNTSRFPVNDPDYPLGLPEDVNPSEHTLLFKDSVLILLEYIIALKDSVFTIYFVF